MEPTTAIIAAAPLVPPALNGLARLIEAIKSPFSKKRLEELRGQLADGLNEVLVEVQKQNDVIAKLQGRVEALKTHNRCIESRLAYLELPFWRRWFTRRPTTC